MGTNYQSFVDDSADITEEDETPELSNIIEGDYQQLLEEKNIINKNAITYVTGYLAQNCLQKHPCETCTNALTNNVLDSPDKLFTYFKSFDETDSAFGKLTVPANELIKYITGIDAKLVETFKNIMTINGIGKYLVANLPKFYLQECVQFPSEYLLKLFVKRRMHYILKFGNGELLIPHKNGKKNRKYLKVTHLSTLPREFEILNQYYPVCRVWQFSPSLGCSKDQNLNAGVQKMVRCTRIKFPGVPKYI